MLHPAKHTRVIQGPALLPQHSLQLPIAQGKSQIPTHIQQNQLTSILTPFKIIFQGAGHGRLAYQFPLSLSSKSCNTTLEYALTPRGLSQLREKLSHFVNTEILPTRFNFRLAAGQSWKSDEVVGKDRWFYTFAVCDVSLAKDGVRFRLDVFRHSPKGSVKRVYGQPQRALRAEETVPIPNIPYALKVDGVSLEQAVFCVCHPR